MKKIGIVTIVSRNNGNRLQNYALQEIIKGLNCDCYTIPMVSNEGEQSSMKIVLKELLSHFIKRYRSISWDTFDKNIKWNKHSVSDMTTEEIQSFDFFVAGSDQIWNPLFSINSDREFLVFAEKHQRIAYAASIGLSYLPEQYEARYNKNLQGFPFISMRENEGNNIVKNLINKEIPVVLDPTMLLTTKEWNEIISKSKIKINKKYALKYFLGKPNHIYNEFVEKHARKNGLLIFDFEDYISKKGERLGPSEFLYLIKNSEMVYTDSFHGTVFSILFHKQFILYDRVVEEGYGEMSSRLSTLLSSFNLEKQRFESINKFDLCEKSINYYEVDIIMKNKRRDSIHYLANIISCN